MNFLAPLFLAGAAAVAFPILFHLIRRHTREKAPFSSLMFLMPTPPRITRRSRLENLWLLLLRCLALALIVLAFARPFLRKPMASDPAAEGGRKVVVLVDRSASMRREGLWADALRGLEETLRAARPGDRVAVWTFGKETERWMGFDGWGAAEVSRRSPQVMAQMAARSPTWEDGNLGGAVLSAAEALEEGRGAEKGRFNSREIVVISDLQEGSRLEGLTGYEWPRGIEVEVKRVTSRQKGNAGVHLVRTADVAGGAGPVVRIVNSADGGLERFRLRWIRAEAKGAVAEGAMIGGQDFYVPRGQGRVFHLPVPPTGFRANGVELLDDAVAFDNRAYFVPAIPQRLKVIYAGRADERDPAGALYYLKRALQPAGSLSVEIELLPSERAGGETRWREADAMVVGGPIDAGSVRALGQFLQGKKVALLALDASAPAGVLQGLAGFESVAWQEETESKYAMLGKIDFEHPLFAPFADPRYSDFTRIHFWKHRKISGLPASARVVAAFDDGSPAVTQCKIGSGTLFLLASGWMPSESQLGLSSKFVPLLYSVLEQGGAMQETPATRWAGERVSMPPGARWKTPAGEMGRGATNGMEAVVSLAEVGIYTRMDGAGEPMAVNVSPEESRTVAMSGDDLRRFGVTLKGAAKVSEKTAGRVELRQAAELEGRQKGWRWLIVAALGCVLVESVASGWMDRRRNGGELS